MQPLFKPTVDLGQVFLVASLSVLGWLIKRMFDAIDRRLDGLDKRLDSHQSTITVMMAQLQRTIGIVETITERRKRNHRLSDIE